MKLTVFERKAERKTDAKKVRREGNIPANLYGPKQTPRTIAVKASEMKALLRSIRPQLLSTTIFELAEKDKSHRVLIKDIDYHPTSYDVHHVDFFLLEDNVPVSVNVPIQIHGAMECVGVRLGGFVRHVIRSLKVRCLPRDLPKEFVLDVLNLEIGQAKRLADIPLPQGVKPLARMNEVAVVIAKKV